jgi:hypothetical protein
MSHLDNHYIPASKQREVPPNLNWIGKSMKRVEDPRLLAGKGRYVDDVVLPNMAHAAVLRSPHAHARIKTIDSSKAEALPGVVLVMTGAQAAELTGPVASFASPPLVQLHGDRQGAAWVRQWRRWWPDRYIAEDALLIELEWLCRSRWIRAAIMRPVRRSFTPIAVRPTASSTAPSSSELSIGILPRPMW